MKKAMHANKGESWRMVIDTVLNNVKMRTPGGPVVHATRTNGELVLQKRDGWHSDTTYVIEGTDAHGLTVWIQHGQLFVKNWLDK